MEKRNYEETVEWLYRQLPMFQSLGAGAYKPGLDTAHLLDDAFGNPHRKFKTVHVAGTNGKGSVSHTIAAILMADGHKVGLYTSPHLKDFRERIRVNGEKVTKDFVVDFIEKYQAMGLDCQPSFFELTTIMAFKYFQEQGVDYAVIEVGLGGRLDTTNIITPVLSVITNISLDHTALLGDTDAEIAGEKAGIIKPGVPVVIGRAEGDVRRVFEEKAKEMQSPIVFAQDSPYQYEIDEGFLCFKGVRSCIPVKYELTEEFQAENGNTVLHAVPFLFVSDVAILQGMNQVIEFTHIMGRWMTMQKADPTVVCDTGHNPGAWEYLGPRLQEIADKQPLRVVLGFANDKDITAIMHMLPKNAEYYFVQPSVKRAANSATLLFKGIIMGLKGHSYRTVEEGYKKALADSSKGDFVFVGGSNYVVAEIL